MKKQPQQLLASQGLFRSSIALLIFSTLAHNPNIHAYNTLVAASALMTTGTAILGGKGASVVGTEDTSNKMMWEALGFESAQQMKDFANLHHVEHSAMLAALAERSASIENLKALPDDFIAPNGASKTQLVKTASQKAINQSLASPKAGLFSEIDTPVKNLSLVQPTAEIEANIPQGSLSCGSGLSCDEKLGIVKQVTKNMESDSMLASNDLGANGATGSAAANTGMQSFNFGQMPSGMMPHSAVSSTSRSAPITLNPIEELKSEADSLTSFLDVSHTAVVNNPEIFKKMPAGWFPSSEGFKTETFDLGGGQTQESGVMFRGALDKAFIPEPADHHDNFVQVVLSKKVGDLGPGVYHIRKTDISKGQCKLNGACSFEAEIAKLYQKYNEEMAEYLAKPVSERGKKVPQSPVKADIMSQISIALRDPALLAEFKNNSVKYASIVKDSYRRLAGRRKDNKIDTRSTIDTYYRDVDPRIETVQKEFLKLDEVNLLTKNNQ